MDHKCFVFRFGDIEVKEREFLLIKSGEAVHVEPTAFRVLLFLLRNPGRLVTKDEILSTVWNDVAVSDNSLTRSIFILRRLLGDDIREPRYIATVHTVGYRFLCEVAVREDGFIAEIETDASVAPGLPGGRVLVASKLMGSAHPPSDRVLHEFEEPVARMQPVAEAASVKSAPASRNTVRILSTGAVVIAAFVAIWSVRNRPAAPLSFKEQQLTHNSNDNPITSVAVSPDGKYFAYSDLGGLHLKLLQTGEVHDFPQPPEVGKARAHWLVVWLPDSVRFLAVAFGMGIPNSTWQASVVSGSLRILRKDAISWSVSPDGSQFAFTDAGERQMWLMGIQGDHLRKMADAGRGNWFSYIEWSPDGSRLLYIKRVPTADHLQNFMEMRDLKSGSTTAVLSGDTLRSVYWLHDGRILYVESDPDTNEESCHNWIARMDKGSAGFSARPRQLTLVNGLCISSASATADGKQLYFLKQTSEFSVYVSDLAPDATSISPPRHLTLTEGREFPTAWTADSREIVLVSNRDGKWGFYRQPLNSNTATPILTNLNTTGLGAIFPKVTPDGAWLVYAPYPLDHVPGGSVDIWKVPISGGSPQLVMKVPLYDIPRCARAPATLCAVAAKNNDQLIFTGFDVVRATRTELARLKIDDPDKVYTWDLSPDGARIAILKRGTSEIHVFSLRTHVEQKITVKGWDGLQGLDWASDGRGMFTSSLSAGSVLLHTDLQGNARALWEPKGDGIAWTVSSPDGHHVAMPGFALSSNIWEIQNF
jgi:DNA-binding winged helix-turn-helix (wHTH) protein/Tol biopolymer transport system component